jgi:7-carboxy-7-deazaguanine synthase
LSAANYKVKEVYYTLQGEGIHTGQPAVFCRFTGCNLWSGREEDREKAVCTFCDTDFVGTDGVNGGRYTADELAHLITSQWPSSSQKPIWCVFTGGEPMLQVDLELIKACHDNNIYIAIETNGTLEVPREVDWICVSPKAGSEIVQRSGDEIKLVVPQLGAEPERFEDWDFEYFSLQPMDGPQIEDNIRWATNYCLRNPKWRLSLQTHKFIGLP